MLCVEGRHSSVGLLDVGSGTDAIGDFPPVYSHEISVSEEVLSLPAVYA